MRRLIAFSIISVLLSGCSAAFDLNASRNFADNFMQKLARADLNGAWEMCDESALNRDTLDRIASNPDFAELFRDYKGLEHGDGGQLTERNGFDDVRLAPAKVKGDKGTEGCVVHFGLRKYPEGWKVIAFQIDRSTRTE